MTLDAFTAAVLRRMVAAYPDLGGTVTDATEARHLLSSLQLPAGPSVRTVTDTVLPGGDVRVRVYEPTDPTSKVGPGLPLVVYLHGGGFVLCDLDTHDAICRLLATSVPAAVVAVDYRRAPEHPFPAAPDDAYAATRWAWEQATSFGARPDRLAVAGDSAGGALAAATCLRARELGGPPLRYQLLVYPVTDCAGPWPDDSESLLRAAHMEWFTRQYLPTRSAAAHPYASPLRAPDLAGLPPAFVLTAEHDPLRPEGRRYAERLARAGVDTVLHEVPGLFHGLLGFGQVVPVARDAERAACEALRSALHDDDRRSGSRRTSSSSSGTPAGPGSRCPPT